MGTYWSSKAKRKPLGIRVVCISDTHGRHRKCEIPDGDVLVHAGDFTRYGKRTDAEDFNKWLGELPHKHKIVVNGNHECNAPWKSETAKMLSSAHFLNDSGIEIVVDVSASTASESGATDTIADDKPATNGTVPTSDNAAAKAKPAVSSDCGAHAPASVDSTKGTTIAAATTTATKLETANITGAIPTSARSEVTQSEFSAVSVGASTSAKIKLRVWGTNFFWPMKAGTRNPHYDMIPDCDILVAHGPAKDLVDGGSGCPALRQRIEELTRVHGNPRLVVSGHIHAAHGVVENGQIFLVNAAMAQKGHGHMGWPAIVIDL